MKTTHVLLSLVLILAVLPLAGLWVGGHVLDAFTVHPARAYAPPSAHAWAGRDKLGRDYMARLALAAGESVLASAMAASLAFLLAVSVGATAGWRANSRADVGLGFLQSLLFTVPFFLLAVAIGTVMHSGLFGIYFIVGLVMWAPAARIARAESIRVRKAPCAIASRAYGFTLGQQFRRVYLPQISLAPAISILYLMPELLGLDVGLSFFGLGATPPQPTLGRLVFEGISTFPSAWWLLVLPGILLVCFCLACYALLHSFPAIRS